jgi:signal transduction histidine kinase
VKTGRFWGRISQKTTFLVLAVAVLSVIALIWMGARLIQQDRALETRQLEERREAAADRLIVALDQLLSRDESRLFEPQPVLEAPIPDDFLIVSMDSGEIRALPKGALLYYPFIPPSAEETPRVFRDAEIAEFQSGDYAKAITLLRPLLKSDDLQTRALTMLRLARNQRKSGRLQEALLTYQDLLDHAGPPDVLLSGVPIDLIAHRARCGLLEEIADRDRLLFEAKHLHDELSARRWRVDRATYFHTKGQIQRWLGADLEADITPEAIAEAVVWVWDYLSNESSEDSNLDDRGRRTLMIHNRIITVLWRRSTAGSRAIIAGPQYQKDRWFGPLFSSAEFSGVDVSLRDRTGGMFYGREPAPEIPSTSRAGVVTGLPWDIQIMDADIEADLNQFAQRRRIMAAGLGILALLVIAVSLLIGRAVSRELAAARLQADFVSAVSHEFRTPLTSMRQFTEMLIENDSLSHEKRRTFYAAQARATRRLARLVESLLDFGRMEAGARPYRLEPVDAGRLTSDLVHEYRQELGPDSAFIECDVPDAGPVISADRDALAQALWNLIDNAVKYSPEGKTIRVEVRAENQAAIRIRDHGIGIPAGEISRIRRKFVRGSNTRDHGVKGTGIGLAVVEHILAAHGGELEIESEPQKGSTFTILLPREG